MADTQQSLFAGLADNPIWMQRSDILMGIGVISVVAMLVIPLPTFLLDFLMALSVMLGLLTLMVVMFVQRSFDFSVFPSLLLVSTVFRLALNVSSTRLILLNGAAFDGKIVRTFGDFVVGGNYVVGFIIFIILVAVQFMVITKGATRTAEVAARFTLDAMPGKQMSIDMDLSNGIISEDEARNKRESIQKEADFYGAMDGASKFVQGDVKVGIIITLINVIGGFIVGMTMRGESFDTAVQTYTLLTIGDGLVSQIPSLLITTATGIIVTRAVSNENLGKDLSEQLSSQPRALYIASGALAASALIPGFPKIPVLLIAAAVAGMAFSLSQEQEESRELEEAKKQEAAMKDHKPEDVIPLIQVDPLEVEIGYNLIPLVDPEQGGTLLDRITNIRRRSALDMGLIVPPIRIRDNMDLEPQDYSVLIKGVEVGHGALQVGRLMAMDPGTVIDRIEGNEFQEPVFNLQAIWIDAETRDTAEARGYTVVDPPTMIATHLTELIKRHADEILGRQEVKKLMDNVEKDYPAVVEDVKENLSLGEIQAVLQNLLRERVSIRNMVTILETLASYSRYSKDPNVLTEYARQGLGRQITAEYLQDNSIYVVTVDPQIEQVIQSGIHDDPVQGQMLVLDPDTQDAVIQSLMGAYEKASAAGMSPVFLVSPVIRSAVFAMLERVMGVAPAVLSYNEIQSNVGVQNVATAQFAGAA